ncbi:hypothetical protein DPX16_7198 [Anabarilius grahami]|uniref:Uncharacterized protein n=1 Tax=Anabarilius grahami TaxID=495550 RepID=A0A3N0XMP5_ANAGA|nr:hypothetical protein DPX16_7198 [Anabarilius grahami]
MSVSSIPTMFPERPEQSSSKFSDELVTALAEGRWWAIMEVSDPISAENEYVDLISGQWGETVEAGGTSRPTSLLSGASEKIPKSDETLNTTKKRKKQKSKNPKGAPVSETTEGRKLASFPVFCDGSESPQWRQKPQKAPDGSTQGARVLDRSQKNSSGSKKGDLSSSSGASQKPEFISVASLNARDKRRQFRKKKQKAAPVPVESPQEPPVPDGSQQRGKLRIPDHLVRHLQKASSELGAPLPAGSHPAQETPKSLQGAPVVPNGAPKRQKLKIPEPLRRELLKQKPLASSGQGSSNPAKSKQDSTVPDRTPVRVPVHAGTQEGAAVSAESPKGAAVPASSAQGAPMSSRIARVAPVLSGTPQGAHVPEGSPQQEENLKFPMQWREQWRQQKTPQRTPTSDRAGVDQSPAPKKPRLDQQSEPEQIDDLCCMFAKFFVISHI